MPNKNYLRGRRLEWQVKTDMEKLGWIALRTAGSHGPWDIICFKDTGTRIIARLIQCKVVKTEKQIDKLVKDFIANAPLGHYQYTNKHSAVVQQDLIIKVTGSKEYITYPLE